jgi:type III secretion system (T3SS) inner membrane Yop/YscD-like protein
MEHVLKDADVGIHPKVQFHCSKCGRATIVDNTRRPDSTMVISPLPSFARSNTASSNLQLLEQDDGAKLPATRSVTLTVVSGPGKGAVYKLSKPRVIVGREGADIALQDPEISRHHCVLEVRGDYVNLRDLDSTNGTFYEEERARAAMLSSGSEFRVGVTVLRLTFEPK